MSNQARTELARASWLLDITHAKSKTQIVPWTSGLPVRNRRSHADEVACVALSLLARLPNVSPDTKHAVTLVSLLHDLGHPPFGHVGERALDRLTADVGGFESNAHGIHLLLWNVEELTSSIRPSVKHWDVIPETSRPALRLIKGIYAGDVAALDQLGRRSHDDVFVNSVVDLADRLSNAAYDLVDLASLLGPGRLLDALSSNELAFASARCRDDVLAGADALVDTWLGDVARTAVMDDSGVLVPGQHITEAIDAYSAVPTQLFLTTADNARFDSAVYDAIELAWRRLSDLDQPTLRSLLPAELAGCPCRGDRLIMHVIQTMGEAQLLSFLGPQGSQLFLPSLVPVP